MKALSELKIGDDVVIRGTIDYKKGETVWLVVDGAPLGRLVFMPSAVLAEKTGESPNYRKTDHETYSRG